MPIFTNHFKLNINPLQTYIKENNINPLFPNCVNPNMVNAYF